MLYVVLQRDDGIDVDCQRTALPEIAATGQQQPDAGGARAAGRPVPAVPEGCCSCGGRSLQRAGAHVFAVRSQQQYGAVVEPVGLSGTVAVGPATVSGGDGCQPRLAEARLPRTVAAPLRSLLHPHTGYDGQTTGHAVARLFTGQRPRFRRPVPAQPITLPAHGFFMLL